MKDHIVLQFNGHQFTIDLVLKRVYRDIRVRGYLFYEIETYDPSTSINTELEFYPYKEALNRAKKLLPYL